MMSFTVFGTVFHRGGVYESMLVVTDGLKFFKKLMMLLWMMCSRS